MIESGWVMTFNKRIRIQLDTGAPQCKRKVEPKEKWEKTKKSNQINTPSPNPTNLCDYVQSNVKMLIPILERTPKSWLTGTFLGAAQQAKQNIDNAWNKYYLGKIPLALEQSIYKRKTNSPNRKKKIELPNIVTKKKKNCTSWSSLSRSKDW